MFGIMRRSIKRRWSNWRARTSLPALLAGADERKVISLFAAVNGGVAILIISVLAWLANLPLLFPALGPSAFLMFSKPFSPDSAPRSVVVGHFAGMTSGFVTWHLASLLFGKPISPEVEGWPTFACAALALAATCVLLVRLSCSHAPACATALIVALGAAGDASALLGIGVGVLLLTAQAILFTRLAGVSMPTWAPRRGVHHDETG